MGKIISIYKDNIDKVWYNSSNIAYSECLDRKDALKEVKVVFKNGTAYTYSDVAVQDYLMFREDASQGKALNQFIKKYKFTKHEEKCDLGEIEKEMNQTFELLREQTTEKETDE